MSISDVLVLFFKTFLQNIIVFKQFLFGHYCTLNLNCSFSILNTHYKN